MLDTTLGTMEVTDREWRRDSRLHERSNAARELKRHFREKYPVLLDGALPMATDMGNLVRQARESLARGRIDPGALPAEILRETLETLSVAPRPAPSAGFTAIGPRHARVWWDDGLADDLTDVIAALDKPHLILRFYDVTDLGANAGRWHEVFDVDVELEERGHTMEFWAPGRAYVVELGYLHADGRFLCLARTNAAELPRTGDPESHPVEMVYTSLVPRLRERSLTPVPDAKAKEWTASRPDHASRDLEAEYFIHMVYRAFLHEGPRALRRMDRPLRRDPETLLQEYQDRERSRKRRAIQRRVKKIQAVAPTVIVARLDARHNDNAAPLVEYPTVPAAHFSPLAKLSGDRFLPAEGYALILAAIVHARAGRYLPLTASATNPPASVRDPQCAQYGVMHRTSDLVRPAPLTVDISDTRPATPVFEAARKLREHLANLTSGQAGKPEASVFPSSSPAASKRDLPSSRMFGGAEARRFAKAGVRFTRMSLTLEGRMRPGARLKVAGKLVHADADGHFSLECVLNGRKAAIPMRAGTSIGGEARSLINVEWNQQPVRERKKG